MNTMHTVDTLFSLYCRRAVCLLPPGRRGSRAKVAPSFGRRFSYRCSIVVRFVSLSQREKRGKRMENAESKDWRSRVLSRWIEVSCGKCAKTMES